MIKKFGGSWSRARYLLVTTRPANHQTITTVTFNTVFCSTNQLVLYGSDQLCQASVHFPLSSAVSKSQQHHKIIFGSAEKSNPGLLDEKQECCLGAVQPHSHSTQFIGPAPGLTSLRSVSSERDDCLLITFQSKIPFQRILTNKKKNLLTKKDFFFIMKKIF